MIKRKSVAREKEREICEWGSERVKLRKRERFAKFCECDDLD